MKVLLGDDAIGEIRQDCKRRNIQLATAFIARAPYRNRHIRRTATGRGKIEHLNVVLTCEHWTTRRPHSTLKVSVAPPMTQGLEERHIIGRPVWNRINTNLIWQIASAFQRDDESPQTCNVSMLLERMKLQHIELQLAGSKKRNSIAIDHWPMLLPRPKGGILPFAKARIDKVESLTISVYHGKLRCVQNWTKTIKIFGHIDRRYTYFDRRRSPNREGASWALSSIASPPIMKRFWQKGWIEAPLRRNASSSLESRSLQRPWADLTQKQCDQDRNRRKRVLSRNEERCDGGGNEKKSHFNRNGFGWMDLYTITRGRTRLNTQNKTRTKWEKSPSDIGDETHMTRIENNGKSVSYQEFIPKPSMTKSHTRHEKCPRKRRRAMTDRRGGARSTPDDENYPLRWYAWDARVSHEAITDKWGASPTAEATNHGARW